jgi:hypothetical protein
MAAELGGKFRTSDTKWLPKLAGNSEHVVQNDCPVWREIQNMWKKMAVKFGGKFRTRGTKWLPFGGKFRTRGTIWLSSLAGNSEHVVQYDCPVWREIQNVKNGCQVWREIQNTWHKMAA